FYRALIAAWKVLDDTNSYFADQQPWVLRKTDEARMKTVLWVTLEVVRRIGLLIQAVMPDSATKLLDALGITATGHDGDTSAPGTGARSLAACAEPPAPGTPIAKPSPVFPSHEEDE